MFSTIMCSKLKLMQNHNGKFANVEKMHTLEKKWVKEEIIFKNFSFFKFTGILLACVSIHHWGQKRATDLQNWSYTQMLAAMWMLGIKVRSSVRATSIHNHWAISSGPQKRKFLVFRNNHQPKAQKSPGPNGSISETLFLPLLVNTIVDILY